MSELVGSPEPMQRQDTATLATSEGACCGAVPGLEGKAQLCVGELVGARRGQQVSRGAGRLGRRGTLQRTARWGRQFHSQQHVTVWILTCDDNASRTSAGVPSGRRSETLLARLAVGGPPEGGHYVGDYVYDSSMWITGSSLMTSW